MFTTMQWDQPLTWSVLHHLKTTAGEGERETHREKEVDPTEIGQHFNKSHVHSFSIAHN